MNVINLNSTYYCLYIKVSKKEEKLFLQADISSDTPRYRLDLFENEEVLYRWIKEEQDVQALNKRWIVRELYKRLYPKRMFISEFSELMKEKEEIDSVSVVDKNGIRRLYFREDFNESGYDVFPMSDQQLHPNEPIYIINRQKELDEKTILQKEAYFVTFPEIATPLFSAGIIEWANDLINRKPEHGYYIEQTTLYDVYMRTRLESKDPGFFILSREESPHYILRRTDLKKIVEGRLVYQ